MRDEKRCDECASWFFVRSGMGECRFNPPVVVHSYLQAGACMLSEPRTLFPMTHVDEWCEKFKSKVSNNEE